MGKVYARCSWQISDKRNGISVTHNYKTWWWLSEAIWYDNELHRVNHLLKKIGKQLDLPMPLTMYVGRHSWASIAKSRNVPISVISEGMGHDSESTTQIYLASLDTTVVDKANKKILDLLWSSGCLANLPNACQETDESLYIVDIELLLSAKLWHIEPNLLKDRSCFFLFHQCDVPSSVHRDNTDEGVDADWTTCWHPPPLFLFSMTLSCLKTKSLKPNESTSNYFPYVWRNNILIERCIVKEKRIFVSPGGRNRRYR